MSRALFCFLITIAVGVTYQPPSVLGQQKPPGDVEDSLPDFVDVEEESPLLVEPTTPEEMFDAVVLMLRLARPKLARLYLEKLDKANPNAATLLKIRDKHGPATFLKLAHIEDLQPISKQLLDRVNRAFREQGANPARIDKLIKDLSSNAQDREVAIIALRDAGPIVVPRLLAHLGDVTQRQQHDLFLYTLTKLGRQVIPPLLGALDAPNDNLRSIAIETLGLLGSGDVVPHLWYPAFAKNQSAGIRIAAREALSRILKTTKGEIDGLTSFGVTREMQRVALSHFRNEYNWQIEANEPVALWTWQQQANRLGVSRLTPEAASLYVGSKLARQTLEIAPENRDVQVMYLLLSLASEHYRTGWEHRLPTGRGTVHDLALSAGAETLSEVLAAAIKNAHTPAVLATLQVLGKVESRKQLHKTDSRKAPIISALNYPDGRVQFAAATAILELDPEKPFRGARRVVQILTRALTDEGAARAVVIDASTQRSSKMAGFLNEMGYDPLLAPRGQDGFRFAVKRGDVELIVVQANSIQWGLSQTIANLRADARTAGIPIAVVGDATMQQRVTSSLRRHAMVTFVIEPSTTRDFKAQLQPFLESMKTPPLTQVQRTERIATAAFWLAHIAGQKRTHVFDIRPAEQALVQTTSDAKLAGNAVIALSSIPTEVSQRQLFKVVARPDAAVELKEAAALHLAFHIQRFGLLLSLAEVAEMEQLWRATTDSEMETALAAVVGSLKPNAKRVSGRLRNFPAPAIPTPPK